jgi:hypothetical protein
MSKIQLSDLVELNNKMGKWSVIGDDGSIIFSGTKEQCNQFWKKSVYFLAFRTIDLTKKYER